MQQPLDEIDRSGENLELRDEKQSVGYAPGWTQRDDKRGAEGASPRPARSSPEAGRARRQRRSAAGAQPASEAHEVCAGNFPCTENPVGSEWRMCHAGTSWWP